MANIIYGLNADRGLSDLIDADKALITLGLDPTDLNALGDMTSKITRRQFHHLSMSSGSPNAIFNENIIERISKYSNATDSLVHQMEDKAGPSIVSTSGLHTSSITGNIVVNGPIGGPSIRYFSTELLKEDGAFEPLDISTSRVSAWSRSGSKLSFGGDLKIDNISPAYAAGSPLPYHAGGRLLGDTPKLQIGKLIVDGRPQLTTITTRKFAAEQATHKVKVNINGKDYYAYAMKNIPLLFNASFTGPAFINQMEVEKVADLSTEYRVFTANGNVVDISNAAGNLKYPLSSDFGPKVVEVYQNPTNIKSFKIREGIQVENFPNATYSNMESLIISGNPIKRFPNLNTIAPSITTLEVSLCEFGDSPIGSDIKLNRLTNHILKRIPPALTSLKIAHSFTTAPIMPKVMSADFKRFLPNLKTLHLGDGSDNNSLNSPRFPEVGPSVTNYNGQHLDFEILPGVSVVQKIPLKFPLAAPANNSLSIGAPTRPTTLKIRRALDKFRIEFDSPGRGYTASSYLTFNTAGLYKSGASTPQGIVDGDITIRTDSEGKITSGYYAPHLTKEQFNQLTIAFPKKTIHPSIVETDIRRPHSGVVGLDGYSPMGFYVDCGMFSSPCGIETLTINHARSKVNNRFDAVMNPFFDSTRAEALGFGNTNQAAATAAGTNILMGSSVNNTAAHRVYSTMGSRQTRPKGTGQGEKKFLKLNFNHCNMPIPFMKGDTSLTSIAMHNNYQHTDGQHIVTIEKVENILGNVKGLQSPTDWQISSLNTLYDSPQDSPADKSYNSDGNHNLGQNGINKIQGCTSLTSIDIHSSWYGGTLPSLSTLTSLTKFNANPSHFNRTESYKDNTHFPVSFFSGCRDTLKEFKYRKNDNYNHIRQPAFGYMNRLDDNGNVIPVTSRIAGWAPYPLARFTEAEAGVYNSLGIVEGDYFTDLLGDKCTHFMLNTRRNGKESGNLYDYFIKNNTTGEANKPVYGITGDLPTFKNATSLQYLNLNENSFDGKIDNWNLTSQRNKHNLYVQIHRNRIKGDLSIHKLANGNGGTSYAFKFFNVFRGYENNMRKIEDWGLETDSNINGGKTEFRHFQFQQAFDCPGYDSATYQAILEPTSSTYSAGVGAEGETDINGSARWLLDRRKDGTADKYEFDIPNMKNCCRGHHGLNLSNGNKITKMRGPFRRWDMGADYTGLHQQKFGIWGNSFIDLRGNGFNKEAIIELARGIEWYIENHSWYKSRLGFQVKLDYQRGYNSPQDGTATPGLDGKTDFRIFPDFNLGHTLSTFHPQSVYRNPHLDTSKHVFNTLEVNDLFANLEDKGIRFSGIKFSRVPPAPEAPNISLNLTGNGSTNLHTTRLGSDGVTYNLFNWDPNVIDGVINVSNVVEAGTTKIEFFKVDWQGVKTQITDATISADNDRLENFYQIPFRLNNIFSLEGDINAAYPTEPQALTPFLPVDSDGNEATNFGNNIQIFQITCEVTGFRPGGGTSQTTIKFVNFEQTRTGATSDANHARGEWKTEVLA